MIEIVNGSIILWFDEVGKLFIVVLFYGEIFWVWFIVVVIDDGLVGV